MQVQRILFTGNKVGLHTVNTSRLLEEMMMNTDKEFGGQVLYTFFLVEKAGELNVWAYPGQSSDELHKVMRDMKVPVCGNGTLHYHKKGSFSSHLYPANWVTKERKPKLREEVLVKELDYMLSKALLEVTN